MNELSSASTRARRPSVLLSLIGAYLCFTLASAGVIILFEGLTTGNYGWVRGFGAVSLAIRPAAFVAVTLTHLAVTFVTGWGMISLILRLRQRARPS